MCESRAFKGLQTHLTSPEESQPWFPLRATPVLHSALAPVAYMLPALLLQVSASTMEPVQGHNVAHSLDDSPPAWPLLRMFGPTYGPAAASGS